MSPDMFCSAAMWQAQPRHLCQAVLRRAGAHDGTLHDGNALDHARLLRQHLHLLARPQVRAAAKEHLEAGDTLVAWGHGQVESEEPVVIEALSLVMKVKPASDGDGEGGSDHVAWEGVVVAIDLEAGTLSLDGGKVIRVIEETQISDDYELPSLAAAREALEGGADVVAWGEGEVESEEPLVIVALTLVMKVQ